MVLNLGFSTIAAAYFEGWKMAFGFGRIFIDESFCCLSFFSCTLAL